MNAKRIFLSDYKNAAEDFYIMRITKPREALNLHTHDFYQVYYVRGGQLIHHLGESTAHLSYGDVFILPPNLPHYIEAEADEVDFYSLSFTTDFLGVSADTNKLVSNLIHSLRSVNAEQVQPKFSLKGEDAAFAELLLHRIENEFPKSRSGGYELLREYVMTLLSIFAMTYFEECFELLRSEQDEQAVRQCAEYIDRHPDEDITLNEMLHLSAMSRSSFCSMFRAVTNMSFKQYLNGRRVKKAAELISSGEKITVAARLCGYGDFSTFYRNFKKYMSLSPAEYQRISRTRVKK